MSGLFDKPKEVKAPPVPDPAPVPVAEDKAGEEAAQALRRASGFEKTFVTGNLVPNSTGKKKTLG